MRFTIARRILRACFWQFFQLIGAIMHPAVLRVDIRPEFGYRFSEISYAEAKWLNL
jgi:hypothetical protein